MSSTPPPVHQPPTRAEALVFFLKTRTFQARRALDEFRARPAHHPPGQTLRRTPVAAESRSPLWNKLTPAEFPLTAGKIENLRLAARALDGLEIPPGEIFSFWRQLGRTTRAKGFIPGRELREGCLVPAVGGGLCQLTGLLYQAAIAANLEIVERHAHSRAVATGLDATVFWNYVDLRFRAPFHWRLEVKLDATHLTVRIRAVVPVGEKIPPAIAADPPRPAATGDCLSCGQTSCFRHPAATAAHAPALGHSAFLLDARWPEFDRFCQNFSRPGDRWFTPLDADRWKKPAYAWSPPADATTRHATLPTLLRSYQLRRLPAQGARRQATLLAADAALAKHFAVRTSPECRHLIITQNLLPHLWRLGVLGGRSFDVLLHRWPLADLHHHLDNAAAAHPGSPTLADFRADPALVQDESEALAQAARLITPHRAIAARFGHRAWLLDWQPVAAAPIHPAKKESPNPRPHLFLPCSPLGRKGIHELAAALRTLDAELLVLGSAREGGPDPLAGLRWSPATLADLPAATALVLPAWIEHQPRIALQALALGIPVIATTACGLPDHPLLTLVEKPDPSLLAAALRSVLKVSPEPCVA